MTPEAELLGYVSAECKRLGITWFHVPDSRGMARGLPDLIIMGWHGTLFRELKGPHDDLTSSQREAGYRLQAGGLDFAVWRPADLASGRIGRELGAIA